MSVATIKRMEEVDDTPNAFSNNLKRIEAAFDASGIEFIPENGGGAGVRLRKGRAATDHSKPKGPATDAFDMMHEAIEEHGKRRKK